MWLFIAFLAVPLIEITLFIQIGGIIGLGWTLATVVLTAILGTWMVRTQGFAVMTDLRGAFGEMRDPTEAIVHGAMILFSGALLLTPGFFTDAIGFALLVPAVRSVVFKYLRSRVHLYAQPAGPKQQNQGGDIIDADYSEIHKDDSTDEHPSGWTKH